MVTDLLLDILNGLITWMLSVLPEWDMTVDMEGFNTVLGQALGFNDVVPVRECLICGGM